MRKWNNLQDQRSYLGKWVHPDCMKVYGNTTCKLCFFLKGNVGEMQYASRNFPKPWILILNIP